MKTEKQKLYNIVSILQGMRDDYWQDISDPEKDSEDLVECVVFILGDLYFALEIDYAVEVIRVPGLAKVPNISDDEIVKGAFNLRGEVMLAVDIRPLLQIPRIPLVKTSRIILVKSPSFKTGIIAESVLEVTELSYASFLPITDDSKEVSQRYARGMLRYNSEEITLLDMDQLLAAPELIVNLSPKCATSSAEMG